MSARRELAAFALVLAALVSCFLAESLFGGKVLSPADVLFVTAGFQEIEGPDYEPANRLLIDPVLQFQPWLEFNRAMLRQGRLPLWNDASGCGTPHLANGQSAPFDPFHLIAYLGTLPDAHAWMAFARLWVAGLGMFLFARSWGIGPWGRWFSGLTYPFCGFVVVWLLFPVTNVAVWMPWLFLATDRVLQRGDLRGVGLLGLTVGCVFLSGHIQTSAHVLLAGGIYVLWRIVGRSRTELRNRLGITTSFANVKISDAGCHGSCSPRAYRDGVSKTRGEYDPWHPNTAGKRNLEVISSLFPSVRSLMAWCVAVGLGLTLASISIVPLWVYLSKSPVWGDREHERPSALHLSRPRLLDGICTVVPYAFGSQRRGHPNLARAVGVHNLNESAGGYAGLATLVLLVPLAWKARRSVREVGFLVGLATIGFLGAFEYPPVINLLRATPVINITDHRRLVLWVAFSSCLLGGIGLDHWAKSTPVTSARGWSFTVLLAAVMCAIGGVVMTQTGPRLSEFARDHYARAAARTDGADPEVYRRRAERQVEQALSFTPTILFGTAIELTALVGLALMVRRGVLRPDPAKAAVLGLTLAELFAFGYGLNPAIDRKFDRPWPEALARLHGEFGMNFRVLGVGAEIPPNVAMRYGMADPRNYDSVESTRSLDWFEPLYELTQGARSSRRTISWSGVIHARERLQEASVAAVIASTPPPEGAFDRVDRVGSVWVARLKHDPMVRSIHGVIPKNLKIDNGLIEFTIECSSNDTIVIRQSFDPGWRAVVDGTSAVVLPHLGTFLSVPLGRGSHRVVLTYDPPEVRFAASAGLASLTLIFFALTGFPRFRSTRILGQGLGTVQVVGLESSAVIDTGQPDRHITEG